MASPLANDLVVETKKGQVIRVSKHDIGACRLQTGSEHTMVNLSGSTTYQVTGNWLPAWKEAWGYRGPPNSNPPCAVNGCNRTSDVGGHVCFTMQSGAVYIIPICRPCNNPYWDDKPHFLKNSADRAIVQRCPPFSQ